MELRPLDASHTSLLHSLQEQDDVWEFVGSLPEQGEEDSARLFAVIEGGVPIGVAGLISSRAFEGKDLEVLCAMRSEAQHRGLAKRACELILGWAFETAKLDRVIACIDADNQGARSIAMKIGMKECSAMPPRRIVYVKYRDERSLTSA